MPSAPAPRRGRPPLAAGQRSQPLTVRLTERKFDQLFARASRDRLTLPDAVRRAVAHWLDEKTDDDD